MVSLSPVGRPQDLDNRHRAALFARAEEQIFDIVVVGGGITGAGIARSAASRGLSVALVEAQDLASGTSSRSSKMIHGGVRYLAQGDLGLVREAAQERQVLRRVAPHLTRRIGFLLPTRSAAGQAKFRSAMWTFEKLGKVPNEDHHEVWSLDDLHQQEPLAAIEGSNGAVRYFEFVTDDARLTLANARSAARDGALILTYAPAVELLQENGRVTGVRVKGALPQESLAATLRARVVINAAGPWVDAVRALEDPAQAPRLTLTKGIHLVVPHERLPLNNTVLMTTTDKRSVFAVPRGAVTYLGTTDTFYAENNRWPEVTAEDVDYLLAAANRSFTGPPLVPHEVIGSWAGLRPLIAEAGKKPSEISRRNELWTGPGGVLTMAGGKLTAYRSMAERVVDQVVETLGVAARPDDTDQQPLVGGDVAIAERNRWLDLYGDEAAAVLNDGGDVAAEVRQAVLREGAVRLEDFWVRRVPRAFFALDGGQSILASAAAEMGRLLGWSGERLDQELATCLQRHTADHALFTDSLPTD
ncbi:MAG: glycerol-3-phosphate dehydrogenase/oxidase [Actinobacteria bacterium]|mgnify:FL=1|nr:glycerol-3-phosphate dehydrogenase/oxidase [Actinomycetota bacterium]MBT4009416.1 glycerol-3-phosphate dehydrogenase/oxidase [Actinomycetota bacterium]